MEPPEKSDEQELQEHIEGRNDLMRALLLCILAVVVVRSFLFEPFKIPSPSMVPTLKIGDHIFVSKFSYGLSLPFTKLEFVKWGEPKRGDIIVFLFPKDESLHYVKRVVGVPGDKVEVKGQEVFINGEPQGRTLVSDPEMIKSLNGVEAEGVELYKETLGDVAHYVRYSKAVPKELSRTSVIETVPSNSFFVMGDNRDDSYDSRSWGFVPRENIKGKAQIIWLSLNNDAAWGSLDAIRWNRCGTMVR